MNKLRAAAEWLLQGELLDSRDGYELRRGPLPEVEFVAKAILAEHPADDDEPITEEWLRSIGFVAYGPFNDLQIKLPALVDGFDDWLRVGDNIGEGEIDFGNALWTVWNYECDSDKPDGATLSCRPTTRRQVRKLLEVLGGGAK